ncbi:hypothetical protein GJ744_010685 [Endocarpon pusillum]|uniref:Uncharacterized protein n=1 Tax=Endocarpon pusillum TaxID=364733 RepID=A0A8H7AEC0_9EURO|nr:hypothetical protein GJ744_010685 [Endocarpon pusillum]
MDYKIFEDGKSILLPEPRLTGSPSKTSGPPKKTAIEYPSIEMRSGMRSDVSRGGTREKENRRRLEDLKLGGGVIRRMAQEVDGGLEEKS